MWAVSHPVLRRGDGEAVWEGNSLPLEVTVGRVVGGLSYLVVGLPHSINPDAYGGLGLVAAGQQEWKHDIEGCQA